MYYRRQNELPQDNSLVLASPVRRLVAFLIDLFIIIFSIVLLLALLQALGVPVRALKIEGITHVKVEGENLSNAAQILLNLSMAVFIIFYFTLSVYLFGGRTLGKWLMRIRVISLYHHRISLWHALERTFGYAASCLELGLGFLQILWNPNRMALHDKVAGTIVIDERRSGYAVRGGLPTDVTPAHTPASPDATPP
ncbi:MAG: RDD family protein [Chitinophagales bacterium]|nr:RDD family protein [Chitinophagales bacterium]MDW8428047.1 RDD family protein [Chitinophagales bacterium]